MRPAMLFFVVTPRMPKSRSRADGGKIVGALRVISFLVFVLFAVNCLAAPGPGLTSGSLHSFIGEYCADCHDDSSKKGGLDLDTVSQSNIPNHPDDWERVIRKLRARQMPPIGKKRPSDETYDQVVS